MQADELVGSDGLSTNKSAFAEAGTARQVRRKEQRKDAKEQGRKEGCFPTIFATSRLGIIPKSLQRNVLHAVFGQGEYFLKIL